RFLSGMAQDTPKSPPAMHSREGTMVAGAALMPTAQVDTPSVHRPVRELSLLALSQVMAMTLWFSATAVLPALIAVWSLSTTGAAWLTAAVQLGFAGGALGSAVLH